MRPEDLQLLRVPAAPALHGDLLVVGLTAPDLAANAYRGGLWRIPLDPDRDGGPRQWTYGEHDTAPRISPDGAWLAFLRSTGSSGRAARPQLHLMPTSGGEPVRLTDLPAGAGPAVWSPDSRRIAFAARVPEPGRYGTPAGAGADGVGADQEAPRWITRLDYRFDDLGFIGDRPSQVFVLEVPAAPAGVVEPVQLTELEVDASAPAWTPDGGHLLFAAASDLGAAGSTVRVDIYAVSASGGQPVLVVRTEGDADTPVVAADGTLYYLGDAFPGEHAVARNAGLWSAPLRLDGPPAVPRRMTEVESVCADRASGPLELVDDGVLIVVNHRGTAQLRLVPYSADQAGLDELGTVFGEPAIVSSYSVHSGQIAAVVSTWDSPGDVVLIGPGEPRRLTDFAAPLRAVGLREPQELNATAPDGYPVHGWLVAPEGEGPHPVLLNIHGGPFRSYGWGFFDEAQAYAAAGYAVVLSNPRGSWGYGEAHGRAIIGALGTVDADDVLALLDTALERPECDAERVGVMGGSYGGFLTGWLAAHHGGRFTAAWSERALNAWDSFRGSSDIGWWFAEAYCGPDAEAQRKASPLYHADKIRIPFLVAHSEQDWRCPVEQAQRMFVALKLQGTPAELLLFPGEGHELSRTGSPVHRQQRLNAVLRWWSRQLPVAARKTHSPQDAP